MTTNDNGKITFGGKEWTAIGALLFTAAGILYSTAAEKGRYAEKVETNGRRITEAWTAIDGQASHLGRHDRQIGELQVKTGIHRHHVEEEE